MMKTFYNLYQKSRAVAVEGQTILIGDTYKICKLNLVQIEGEIYPADWCSVRGWTYYDNHTCERKLIPDEVEILVDWNWPKHIVN